METSVLYGKWDLLHGKIFDGVRQPNKGELDAFFEVLQDFEVMEGETTEEMDVRFADPVQGARTRWNPSRGNRRAENDDDVHAAGAIPTEATFSAKLNLSSYEVGDVVAIYSLACVDQEWLPRNEFDTAQLNVVNARTNPAWYHVDREDEPNAGGTIVRGRLDWWSVPLTVTIGPEPGGGFSLGGMVAGSGKEEDKYRPIETSIRPSDEPYLALNDGMEAEEMRESKMITYSLAMAVLFAGTVIFCVFCREDSDGTDCFSVWRERRKIMAQRISMDEFFKEEEEVAAATEETRMCVQLELT